MIIALSIVQTREAHGQEPTLDPATAYSNGLAEGKVTRHVGLTFGAAFGGIIEAAYFPVALDSSERNRIPAFGISITTAAVLLGATLGSAKVPPDVERRIQIETLNYRSSFQRGYSDAVRRRRALYAVGGFVLGVIPTLIIGQALRELD